jgi:putative tricarboxylic transport membrane protein
VLFTSVILIFFSQTPLWAALKTRLFGKATS